MERKKRFLHEVTVDIGSLRVLPFHSSKSLGCIHFQQSIRKINKTLTTSKNIQCSLLDEMTHDDKLQNPKMTREVIYKLLAQSPVGATHSWME